MNVGTTNIKEVGAKRANLAKQEESFLRAANGRKLDEKESTELRTILLDKPDAWKAMGDLCEQVRLIAIEPLRDNTAAYESVIVGLDRMRAEFGFAQANAVERLLIEQILTCWVQCSMVGKKLEGISAGTHSLEVGLYWERRYNIAQSRYVRTLEALAKIRKLELPDLQVNIGKTQVNVTG